MREPEWIEHDGSDKCPVPAGHDVEVCFGDNRKGRDTSPEEWGWGRFWRRPALNITHYRDWTAFEQNSASEVPKLLTEADFERFIEGGMSWNEIIAELRARDLVAPEPEPVERLREAVQAAILEADRDHAEGTTWIDDFVKGLRAHGVTLEKNNG